MAFFEWEVLSAQLVDVTSALNANGKVCLLYKH